MYALVFPGQGSQKPGMGSAWQGSDSWAVVEEVSDACGVDVGQLLVDAGADELRATGNAQLAVFTLSLVILDAARGVLGAGAAGGGARGGGARGGGAGAGDSQGGQGSATDCRQDAVDDRWHVAGHSLGEYSALVACGVLALADGARLVAARGAAMGAAATATPGSMTAVLGLEPDVVAEACAGVEGAWVANDNAPGQIVIAGTADGLEQAGANARKLGAKRVIPLAVGGAFHTPLMAAAQDDLDAALDSTTFADASVACVANVDASPHRSRSEWPQLLSRQLTSPVRWRETQLRLAQLGVATFVELGPGSELSGMVKRTVEGATRLNVATPDQLAGLEGLADPRPDRLADPLPDRRADPLPDRRANGSGDGGGLGHRASS